MKQLIILTTIFISTIISSKAQDNSPDISSSKKYTIDSSLYRQGKKLHKQGALLLTFGGAAMGVAVITAVATYNSSSSAGVEVAAIMFLGGAGTMIASIPVIIAGHRKMDKSRVRLSLQQIRLPPLPNTAGSMAAVGISIPL